MAQLEYYKLLLARAVIVAQLAERLFPTLEVRGLNPVVGVFKKNRIDLLFLKNENKGK